MDGNRIVRELRATACVGNPNKPHALVGVNRQCLLILEHPFL